MEFQPIVDVLTGKTCGYEALMRGTAARRLESPERLFSDRSSPERLLSLDMACVGSALKHGRGLALSNNVFINVNIETLVGFSKDMGRFSEVLDALNICPDRIVFEISERTETDCTRNFSGDVRRLRDAGFRIAIDDVGPSFKWLHYMLCLRPDFIKIDRSCVSDINNHLWKQCTVQALAGLAGKLGVKVIAEGIEAYGELASLRKFGVNLIQGFLFARPRPAGDWLSPAGGRA
jgi:EAL domain-containing protein (putative c-di-GMP-specific phosphodiesterase class I)